MPASAGVGTQTRTETERRPENRGGEAADFRDEWPREESNLRAQIRSLPLYPLSYGASPNTVAEPGTRFGGRRPSSTALMLATSSAVAAARVPGVALPMCGSRTTFG